MCMGGRLWNVIKTHLRFMIHDLGNLQSTSPLVYLLVFDLVTGGFLPHPHLARLP